LHCSTHTYRRGGQLRKKCVKQLHMGQKAGARTSACCSLLGCFIHSIPNSHAFALYPKRTWHGSHTLRLSVPGMAHTHLALSDLGTGFALYLVQRPSPCTHCSSIKDNSADTHKDAHTHTYTPATLCLGTGALLCALSSASPSTAFRGCPLPTGPPAASTTMAAPAGGAGTPSTADSTSPSCTCVCACVPLVGARPTALKRVRSDLSYMLCITFE
jgi:hypothetical protein